MVIGGGLIGFSAASQLLKRGLRVTVIERGTEAAASCSTGNAGMVVPSHFVPLAAPGMIWKGIRWMFDPESPFAIRPRPTDFTQAAFWKDRTDATVVAAIRAGKPGTAMTAFPQLTEAEAADVTAYLRTLAPKP